LILDVLLQILSAARFTLAIGETLDLRNYIVVANSNLVRGQRIDDESPQIDHADSIEWMRMTRIASVVDCSWKVDQQTRKLWFAEPAGQRPGRILSAIEQVCFERKLGNRQLWTICPVEFGCRHTRLSTWLNYCSRRLHPDSIRTSLGARERIVEMEMQR
jgi:hypothetical protein